MRKPFAVDWEMGHLTKRHKLWLDILIGLAAAIQVVGTTLLVLRTFHVI